MKTKKKIILVALASLAAVTGLIYHLANDKKAYDYSDYYEEVKLPTEKQNNKVNEDDKEPQKALSLSLLKQTNPDVVGILEFDDREIYEPIVQAPDNEFYVRKNIDLDYSAAGIPFISCDGNLSSKNVVIYGHSSIRSNIIFTPLMQYLDEDYYKEHPKFYFEMENEKRTYEIFSVFGYDTRNLNDSLEFVQSKWRKILDFEDFINKCKKKSFYQTDVEVSTVDNLMILVTCDTRNNEKRIVVLAKLIDSERI